MRRWDEPETGDRFVVGGGVMVGKPMPAPAVVFVELVGGGAALFGAEDLEADGHGVGEELGDGGGVGLVEG